jgi:hypothetical protein
MPDCRAYQRKLTPSPAQLHHVKAVLTEPPFLTIIDGKRAVTVNREHRFTKTIDVETISGDQLPGHPLPTPKLPTSPSRRSSLPGAIWCLSRAARAIATRERLVSRPSLSMSVPLRLIIQA